MVSCCSPQTMAASSRVRIGAAADRVLGLRTRSPGRRTSELRLEA
jgi:hypothetical protein